MNRKERIAYIGTEKYTFKKNEKCTNKPKEKQTHTDVETDRESNRQKTAKKGRKTDELSVLDFAQVIIIPKPVKRYFSVT